MTRPNLSVQHFFCCLRDRSAVSLARLRVSLARLSVSSLNRAAAGRSTSPEGQQGSTDRAASGTGQLADSPLFAAAPLSRRGSGHSSVRALRAGHDLHPRPPLRREGMAIISRE